VIRSGNSGRWRDGSHVDFMSSSPGRHGICTVGGYFKPAKFIYETVWLKISMIHPIFLKGWIIPVGSLFKKRATTFKFWLISSWLLSECRSSRYFSSKWAELHRSHKIVCSRTTTTYWIKKKHNSHFRHFILSI